jgi:pyrroloquinoline quinone biosynthesis protein A
VFSNSQAAACERENHDFQEHRSRSLIRRKSGKTLCCARRASLHSEHRDGRRCACDSSVQVVRAVAFSASPTNEEMSMKWIDPAYCDIRLGFEVTAYVYVR